MKAEVNLTEYRQTGEYLHAIGVWTVGCMTELTSEEREAVEGAFNKAPKGDHFYSVVLHEAGVGKVYVAENGEFGYTAMLPEEY